MQTFFQKSVAPAKQSSLVVRTKSHRNFHTSSDKEQDSKSFAGKVPGIIGNNHNFRKMYVNAPFIIQPKLNINQPNDIYEQEADAIADKVMRMPDVRDVNSKSFSANSPKINIQRKCAECEEEEKHIQRKCDKCEDEEKQKLQRKESGVTANHTFVAVDQTLQSPGESLDTSTRSFMENRFGYDFGGVRIHTNLTAQQSAKDINALAYTHQNNIVFGAGQYQPQTDPGKKLLAHELTHVIQQSSIHNKVSPNTGQSSSNLKRYEGTSVLQRQTPGTPSLFLPTGLSPMINLPSDEITIDEAESITAENAKLVTLASAYKGKVASNPQEYIKLSTYLAESFQLDSAKAAAERVRLQRRMTDIQNALIKLGVPANSIEISPATSFATHGAGQVTASLYTAHQSSSYLLPQGPSPGPAAPATAGGSSPSLSDMLSFKFKAGPLQFAVELPKSVAIKLPIALNSSRTLSFELKAESSGDFSFTISLNGLQHINVSAKAAVKVDKDKGTSGSAGLEITTTKTVCNAPSPDSLKAKITASGDKLTKAMKELETAKPDDRLSKLFDIAGAIGEMYDAVDKSKSQCKEVPRATINIGVQTPLSPSDSAVNDPDPTKRPASSVGVTLTVPF